MTRDLVDIMLRLAHDLLSAKLNAAFARLIGKLRLAHDLLSAKLQVGR